VATQESLEAILLNDITRHRKASSVHYYSYVESEKLSFIEIETD
jgi:hypothetical protein